MAVASDLTQQLSELLDVSQAGAKAVCERLRANEQFAPVLEALERLAGRRSVESIIQLAWIEGYKAGLAAMLPPLNVRA